MTDNKENEAVLNFLKLKADRPVSLREISGALRMPKHEYRMLKRTLKSLISSGDIYKTRIGLYGAADEMSLVTGFFEAHRDGYGFVLSEKQGEQDLFIPPRKTAGAMSGDRVTARIENTARKEGSIVKVIQRGQKRIAGRFCAEKNAFYVKPKNRKIPFDIYISPKDRAEAKNGDIVIAEITSYPTASRPPEGRVLKVLGEVAEPKLEIDMIIEEYSLTPKFPAPALNEARSFPEKINAHGRVDCRHLLTVTIDGETAKDFDDAISIEKTPDGFILYVHIADVSHYAPWDSALDIEARQRGTSVYFPHRVIPMLPKELSNNLCSLVPKADRLTVTAELHFDREGELVKKSFYPSVIHSNERMTYTSVSKILVDNDLHERRKYTDIIDSFEVMDELCGLLRKKRIERGSLDFDLPEPEVLFDLQGRPEAIIKAERSLSHVIIEEFMIAANEAVASYLEDQGLPSLYRIHEKPDTSKLEELISVFNALGLRAKKTGVTAFRSILKETKGKPEEAFLNILLLRSLKQAKYSTENTGHFGLASKSYTHFTSPIRRYPDLVVHRILKDSLKNKLSDKKIQHIEKLLPEIAAHSSRTERLADEAEREVLSAMRAWFMKDKVGDEYDGLITDVTPYGLKIQLKDFFVEGFLHVSYMADDYYNFDEKNYRLTGRNRRKTFALGQTVSVRIERVNIEEREIVFALPAPRRPHPTPGLRSR
ncbi:MAG: ribonuclease R [Nitrospirae bacterium]|nr:ribonuclease R [Nitrospirota bacterium]